MKDRIACKCCYNKNRRKNNNNTIIQNQQPKIDNINNNDNNPSVSAYEKHRCVIIGPSNVGKTLYMLKMLEKKTGNKRPVRSPNQYPNYETSNEIKPIGKNKESVVGFDDMLGALKSSQINEFYKRGKNENLDVYYISQRHFALQR